MANSAPRCPLRSSRLQRIVGEPVALTANTWSTCPDGCFGVNQLAVTDLLSGRQLSAHGAAEKFTEHLDDMYAIAVLGLRTEPTPVREIARREMFVKSM